MLTRRLAGRGCLAGTPRVGAFAADALASRHAAAAVSRARAGVPPRLRSHLKREILINGSQRETRVAILEDDRLVELLVDRPDHRRTVGDIYLGRVEAVLPGIQAAFVDIGQEKSAFLHASDLLEPDEDEEPDEEDARRRRSRSSRGGAAVEAEARRGSHRGAARPAGAGATVVGGADNGAGDGGSERRRSAASARSLPAARCPTSRTSSRRGRPSRSR